MIDVESSAAKSTAAAAIGNDRPIINRTSDRSFENSLIHESKFGMRLGRRRGSIALFDYSLRFSSFRAIRGSGINQTSALKTYSPLEIHGLTNASGIAAK